MDVNLVIKDISGEEFQQKTSEEVRSFLEAEARYWEKKSADLGNRLSKSLSSSHKNIQAFLDQLKIIETAEATDPKPHNIELIRQQFAQSKQQLVNWAAKNWVYRGTPFVEAMLSAFEYSQESGNAFLDSIVYNRAHLAGNPPSLNTFTGVVMAYEHRLQGHSALVERRNAEGKSFETLRNDLEHERTRLVSEIAEFRNVIESWRDETEKGFQGWFDRLQKNTADWFAHYKANSEQAVADHSKLFNEMANHAIERNKHLEELYREKLRLEAPAKYWSDRASTLKEQGKGWARLLVLFSLLLSAAAGGFFWTWLTNKAVTPFGLHSLQGVALFGASVAAAVFLVRVLSRLTFSAYHLQRDAEEREQLSHLYLALINEGALDTKSRDIVLQALFSRADSGLLAGDHGPTMPSPGDVVAGISRMKPQ